MLVLKDGCEFTAHSSFLAALQRLRAVSKTTHTNMCKGVWVEKQSPETYILSLPFLLPFLVRNLIAFTVCPCSSVRCRLPLCLPGSVLVLALQMFRTGLRMWLRGKHLPNLHSALGSIPSTATSKNSSSSVSPNGLLGGGGGSVQLLQYVELENRLSFL